jgi:hypothetical protein
MAAEARREPRMSVVDFIAIVIWMGVETVQDQDRDRVLDALLMVWKEGNSLDRLATVQLFVR